MKLFTDILVKYDWKTFAYAAWAMSIFAMLATLYYGNIMLLPVCSLCWYQRIAMYPLVILYPVGIILNDKRVAYYTFPLLGIGSLISVYQVALQAGIIKESLLPCLANISCAEITFRLFGIITIPQQALLGFGVLLLCNYVILKKS